MIKNKEYEPETMQRAEFVAKVFSEIPADTSERILELANSYLDGINTGINIQLSRKKQKGEAR